MQIYIQTGEVSMFLSNRCIIMQSLSNTIKTKGLEMASFVQRAFTQMKMFP